MLQVAASFSDVVNVVVERKALRDTEVDGENTKHPTVKRPKHSAPDSVVRVTGVRHCFTYIAQVAVIQ